MQPPMKYQPYHGYGSTHTLLWYIGHLVVKPSIRVRTRSDWRYLRGKPVCDIRHTIRRYGATQERCPRCGRCHCYYCGCSTPWKRPDKSSKHSTFEKRQVHRKFRRAARVAIERELLYEDEVTVSHAFFISGDYLD